MAGDVGAWREMSGDGRECTHLLVSLQQLRRRTRVHPPPQLAKLLDRSRRTHIKGASEICRLELTRS